MRTVLATFGWSGNVLAQNSGSDIEEPAGSLLVQVPDGKRIKNFDMMGTKPLPIFEDIPKTELEKLQEQNIQMQTYIENMSQVVDLLLTIIAQSGTDISTINDALRGGVI